MKKNNVFRFVLSKTTLALMFVVFSFSSCEKEEVALVKEPVLTSPDIVNTVSDERLLKFLSISLGVQISEISYLKDSNEFLIRNIKFNRTEMEDFYLNANIYRAEHGE